MKYIYIRGKKIYVSEEVYKAYRSSKRREKYLDESDYAHEVVSLETLFHEPPTLRSAEQEYERAEMLKAMWCALDQLTDEEFELISLHFFDGLSVTEIAKLRNEDFHKTRYEREKILKKLRKIMDEID